MTKADGAPYLQQPRSEAIQKAGRTSVYRLFREQASRHPERWAIESEQRQLTYAGLLDRVDRLSDALTARGVQHGHRIAVLSENRHEYVEVQLAAARIGAIVACQNWRLTDSELQHCIDLVSPSMLIFSARQSAVVGRLELKDMTRLEFGDDYEKAIDGGVADRAFDDVDPESGLILLYTSGTTGPAKAALISQRALMARMSVFRFDLGIGPEDAYLAWSPMFHMGGTEHGLSTLMMGGLVIVMDGFKVDSMAEIVGRVRLSWLLLVPATVDPLIEAVKRRGVTPKGVKVVGCMADLLPKATIVELTTVMNAPFFNTFGSTETGLPPASGHLIPPGVHPPSLSKQLSSLCSMRIVDENDMDVPSGAVGQALVRGPTLFSGYWGAPEINERDFKDGWFRMGDLFRKNEDGTVDFAGRAKYLIKSGGENIYPAEIESVLLSDPRIADAVVVRKPDPKWGEVPVAILARAAPDLLPDDVEQLCKRALAGYKRPKEIRFVDFDELPRSSTGKILREDVEKWLLRQHT